MKMLDHLKSRRTVRTFKSDPIPQPLLDVIFEAAMWAPSHGNTQPWEFVTIGPTTRGKLLKMLQAKTEELLADPDLPSPRRAALLALKEDFGGAPFMVAVLSRPPAEDIEKIENPLSTATAVQNMLLAAWDAGVGAVWLTLGSAPPVRPLLDVPEGASVVALLAMGFPVEIPTTPPREPFASRLREVP
jgi:nitroreductase